MKFLLTYCCLVALKVLKATYVSTKQRGGENWFFEWLNINFMSMKTTTTKYFHNAEKLGKAKTKKLNLNQDHMQHITWGKTMTHSRKVHGTLLNNIKWLETFLKNI